MIYVVVGFGCDMPGVDQFLSSATKEGDQQRLGFLELERS